MKYVMIKTLEKYKKYESCNAYKKWHDCLMCLISNVVSLI